MTRGLSDLRRAAKKISAAVYTPKRGVAADGRPVLMRREDYDALLARLEEAEDAKDHRAAMASHGEKDWISAEGARAIVSGESPIKVWRKERGLTQVELAKVAKLSQSHLAEIERGRKEASVSALRALAEALQVEPGDLI